MAMSAEAGNQVQDDQVSDKPDYCLPSILSKVFAPEDASVLLISADGGTGKTFSAVNMMQFLAEVLDFHVITNILFQQRTGPGERDWKDIDPHPNVHTVGSMVDLWKTYAELKRADPFGVVVVFLDEMQKWVDRIRWWEEESIAFKQWWGENRKYRTVPVMITQQMRIIPSRLLRYVRWYISKSRDLANEYNATFGTDYSYKELAFVVFVRSGDELEKLAEFNFTLNDVVEVLVMERQDWTKDPNTAEVGDVCYVSESSANFTMGKVGEDERWFSKFLEHISGCRPIELPDRIETFFSRGAKSPLSPKARLEAALHTYAMHLADDDLSDKGHPLMKLTVPGKRNLQEIELSPANLSRIFNTPERTLRDNIRRWDSANETGAG